MKHNFVISTGNVDSQGDRILPTAFKDLPKTVPLLRDFDNRQPIGIAEVSEENGLIKASSDATQIEGLYPSIGFQVIKSKMEGNIRVIDELKLYSVGIHASPNVDR